MSRLTASFRALADTAAEAAVKWSKSHTGKLIKGVTKTTRERLSTIVQQVVAGGGTVDDVRREAAKLFGDRKRAMLIARTETLTAMNEGKRSAWRQAARDGRVSANMVRVWITSAREQACPICRPMDGKTAEINGIYNGVAAVQGGPPAHPDCRCTEALRVRENAKTTEQRAAEAFWEARALSEYSSTQFTLDDADAQEVLDFGLALIPDDVLAEDGREIRPHITVKYGLHTFYPNDVAGVLTATSPMTVTLGKTKVFHGEDADVVVIAVDSPELHRLNALLTNALPETTTHPFYSPHLTLAYVKPGMGDQFAGDGSMEGVQLRFDALTFSDTDRNETVLPLTWRAAAEYDESKRNRSHQTGRYIRKNTTEEKTGGTEAQNTWTERVRDAKSGRYVKKSGDTGKPTEIAKKEPVKTPEIDLDALEASIRPWRFDMFQPLEESQADIQERRDWLRKQGVTTETYTNEQRSRVDTALYLMQKDVVAMQRAGLDPRVHFVLGGPRVGEIIARQGGGDNALAWFSIGNATHRRGEIIANLNNRTWRNPHGYASDTAGFQQSYWHSGPSVLIHEYGHHQHFNTNKADYYNSFNEAAPPHAHQVSRYGSSNRLEFMAETFSGLMSGKSYSVEVMSQYVGPIPKKRATHYRAAANTSAPDTFVTTFVDVMGADPRADIVDDLLVGWADELDEHPDTAKSDAQEFANLLLSGEFRSLHRGNYGHAGRPGKVGGSTPVSVPLPRVRRSHTDTGKSARSKANESKYTIEQDRWSEKVEREILNALGAHKYTTNEASEGYFVDEQGRLHGIEIKALTTQKDNNKITMRKAALLRKILWGKKNKAIWHTVAVDDRHRFKNAAGKSPSAEFWSGHRIYVRHGVGSFRLGQGKRGEFKVNEAWTKVTRSGLRQFMEEDR